MLLIVNERLNLWLQHDDDDKINPLKLDNWKCDCFSKFCFFWLKFALACYTFESKRRKSSNGSSVNDFPWGEQFVAAANSPLPVEQIANGELYCIWTCVQISGISSPGVVQLLMYLYMSSGFVLHKTGHLEINRTPVCLQRPTHKMISRTEPYT